MPINTDSARTDGDNGQQNTHRPMNMDIRFGAMILTAMVIMYWVMFVGSWEWSHIRFSDSRVFMAIKMGGTMVLIMLGWMLNMYKNTKANIAIIAADAVLIGAGVFLDRSQILVNDTGNMNATSLTHTNED